MTASSRVVSINISRSSPTVTQAAFSAAMFLGKFTLWADDARSYTSLAGLLADGFLTSDTVYLAVADYFAQNPQPSVAIVGRRAMSRTVTVVTATGTTHYIVTIGGVAYDITSAGSTTKSLIQGQLITAINAGTTTHKLTASAVSTDQILLTPASGVCPSVTVTADILTIANTAVVDTIAADLDRIQRANQAWYAIVLCDRDNTDASAVALYIETASVPYYFPYATADANIINSSGETSSLAYAWKAAGYTRSSVFYHSLSATRYPDAALLGSILPRDPGSYTAKFRTLTGIPVDNLTDTQINVAAGYYTGATFTVGKNATVYVAVGGVSMTLEGKVASGEFIDVIIFTDWLKADMTASVFSLFVSTPKVSFTDAGLQGIGSLVRASLARGIAAGGLAETPAPIVSVPKASTYTPTQKASRDASGITFSATLAGAIHATVITGTVSP